jgi:hypothetical protein
VVYKRDTLLAITHTQRLKVKGSKTIHQANGNGRNQTGVAKLIFDKVDVKKKLFRRDF